MIALHRGCRVENSIVLSVAGRLIAGRLIAGRLIASRLLAGRCARHSLGAGAATNSSPHRHGADESRVVALRPGCRVLRSSEGPLPGVGAGTGLFHCRRGAPRARVGGHRRCAEGAVLRYEHRRACRPWTSGDRFPLCADDLRFRVHRSRWAVGRLYQAFRPPKHLGPETG